MVLGSVQLRCCPVFPATLIEEAVFSLLYILGFFIKDKVPAGVWVYLWAFGPVPLVYIPFFALVHIILITVAS